MKDIEIKNPEDYAEFDRMNPGNSAPAVVWLASDDSKPVSDILNRYAFRTTNPGIDAQRRG